MNIEQFEAWLYDSAKKACSHFDDEVVIAYEGDNSIIATRKYIKEYHPQAEEVKTINIE